MIPKPKRIENKELINSYIGLPCIICHNLCKKPHHIWTRGAGGGDTPDNLICLCLLHHRIAHDMPRSLFYERFKNYIPEINREAFLR
jgi:hypothetical protein